MLRDPSKIAITMGLPANVDMNANLVIPGDTWEDPVFVNDNGDEITDEEYENSPEPNNQADL